MSAELKPCPFCGGAARIESNRDWHRLYAAHDDDCVFDADDHVLMYPAQSGYLIEIAEVWNRRPALPVQAGEGEGLTMPLRLLQQFILDCGLIGAAGDDLGQQAQLMAFAGKVAAHLKAGGQGGEDGRDSRWYRVACRMGNAFYNLSQASNVPDEWKESARELVNDWDAARATLAKANDGEES